MVVAVLMCILIIGDPGCIDRDKRWPHIMTVSLIGLISAVNAIAAVSTVKPRAKLMMMAEESISLVVAILVGPDRQHPEAVGGARAGPAAPIESVEARRPEALRHRLLDAPDRVTEGPLLPEPVGEGDHGGA